MSRSLAFVNGPVLGHPPLSRVLVSDGVIRRVGPSVDVTGADVIDLDGRLLCPGFQDSHLHPFHGGLRMLHLDLSDISRLEDGLGAVREHRPEGEWIQGGGWAFDWFEGGCPPAELLDRLVGDRPAFLMVRDDHSAWVNTAALRRAGLDRDTRDPIDSRPETGFWPTADG